MFSRKQVNQIFFIICSTHTLGDDVMSFMILLTTGKATTSLKNIIDEFFVCHFHSLMSSPYFIVSLWYYNNFVLSIDRTDKFNAIFYNFLTSFPTFSQILQFNSYSNNSTHFSPFLFLSTTLARYLLLLFKSSGTGSPHISSSLFAKGMY